MNLMENVKAKAKSNPCKVAFPEADDKKMLDAIIQSTNEGYCFPVLVGDKQKLISMLNEANADISKYEFISMEDNNYKEDVLKRYLTLPNIIYGEKSLRRRMEESLNLALMMEAVGDVDVTFAGITSTTGDIIYAAQTIIGLQENVDVVSSIGIAEIPSYTFADGGHLLAVGDCAVCQNPDANQLASIAISACDTIKAITDWTPRCALLSYSTLGSGSSELTKKVQDAVSIANEKRPDLFIEGEFQLDSAIVPEVAAKKVKVESNVAGKANIIIFPDLNAGNIGVKLIQQFGHANAYGPLLQGFSKIASDCSRGAPVSELVGNIVFSVVRAGDMKNGK